MEGDLALFVIAKDIGTDLEATNIVVLLAQTTQLVQRNGGNKLRRIGGDDLLDRQGLQNRPQIQEQGRVEAAFDILKHQNRP